MALVLTMKKQEKGFCAIYKCALAKLNKQYWLLLLLTVQAINTEQAKKISLGELIAEIMQLS